MRVLKNGTQLNISNSDIIGIEGQHILGIKADRLIRVGSDIFTCDYVPAFEADVVNFENLGGRTVSTATARTGDEIGEVVSNAFGQLSINLQYVPWIDSNKVKLATYSPISGLQGYQPILVKFNNGSIAYNFTNYKDGTTIPLDSDSDNYQFVQNGTSLLFNKPLIESFKVYYQYIPCNVRFRVVLRCNYNTFISPKVDYVHLKAKTRK